jgi:hypothetical protein
MTRQPTQRFSIKDVRWNRPHKDVLEIHDETIYIKLLEIHGMIHI